MINEELLRWMREQVAGGATKGEIRAALLGKGWQEKDVEEALATMEGSKGPLLPGAEGQGGGRIPGVMALFRESWDLYRNQAFTLMGIMLLPAIVLVTMSLFGIGSMAAALPFISQSLGARVIGTFVLLGAVVLVSLLIQGWSQIALIYTLSNAHESVSILDAYKKTTSKLLSYWWVTILSTLIVLGGVAFFIIPGLIFAVWFALSRYVVVTESKTGIAALVRSHEYIKGQVGAIFWRFLCIAVLVLVLSMAVSFVSSALDSVVGVDVGKFMSTVLIIPFAAAYSYLVFSHARAVRGPVAESSKDDKVMFTVFGVIGLLLILGILGLIGYLILTLGYQDILKLFLEAQGKY